MGSKKEVLKFRSNKSIVIAPARTGKDKSNKITVNKIDQTKRDILSTVFKERIFIIVVIKLIAPRIDETPATCKEKIAKSTAEDEWNNIFERGGYTVHPVPTPAPKKEDKDKKDKDGGSNQNLKLFIRGKAISTELIIKGTNQFPNPPIMIGITIKKIIINAWAVTITL